MPYVTYRSAITLYTTHILAQRNLCYTKRSMVRQKQTFDAGSLAGLVSIAMLAFLGYALIHYTVSELPTPKTASSPTVIQQTYYDVSSGLIFTYPSSYRVSEYPDANNTNHTMVTLLHNQLTATQDSSPSLITFDIVTDALRDKTTALEWMKSSALSRFSDSDGTYQRTLIDNGEIITYHWQKISPGISVLFAVGNTIVVASTSYEDPNDAALETFANIAKTIHIQP